MRLSHLFACDKIYHRLKYFYNIFKKHAVRFNTMSIEKFAKGKQRIFVRL